MFNDFLFSENRAVYEIMWKNTVEWAGHRWWYGTCALLVGYLTLHTLRLHNKSKVHARTGHEGPDGSRRITLLFH